MSCLGGPLSYCLVPLYDLPVPLVYKELILTAQAGTYVMILIRLFNCPNAKLILGVPWVDVPIPWYAVDGN
ncbi:hypothetical protein DSO57_1039065 [Entomophthora muscae]|uniref:Uncharacterized protein n=1 Tax=Entomophthora muscae TaxID=34485 RepID=A0ACC2SMG8_9FUNG|nr:hypothetical protein DSO57_1039065 [Entomophthora muscae]